MNTVYIMCGLIGSGKSTYARKQVEESIEPIIVINKDSIREMMSGGKYVFNPETEPIVKEIAERALKIALEYSYDIIIDATNIKAQYRKNWINLVKSISPERRIELVYCNEKKNNLTNRMKSPKGQSIETWIGVYQEMLENFEEPEIEEGYEILTTII